MNERQTEQTTDQKATERPGDQANELMTDWKTTDPIDRPTDRPIGGQKEIMFETKLPSASSFTVFSPNWNSVLFSSHYNMFQKKCR